MSDVAVVDVSVNMQHKFQQCLFMNPEVLDSVHQQSGCYSSCCAETGMHSAVVQRPLRFHRRSYLTSLSCPFFAMTNLVQAVQNGDHTACSSSPNRMFLARFSSVMPTVQFLIKVVDMVACDICPWFRQC